MELEQLRQLETMVGPGLHQLLESEEKTRFALDHPDWKLRFAALNLMTYHWGPTEEFKERCLRAALQDQDEHVRSAGISALGWCYRATGNRVILKVLADLICDESQNYGIRRAAYTSLFIISGVPSDALPREDLLVRPSFPDEISWGFVESYR